MPSTLPPLCVLELFGVRDQAVNTSLRGISLCAGADTYSNLRILNLSGLNCVDADTLVELLENQHLTRNLVQLCLDGVQSVANEACSVIRKMMHMRFLDMTNCRSLTNECIFTLFGKGKNDTRDVIHDSLEYLSVANASQITDESMRFVALLRNLQDLCIFGCHKITDSGVYNLANRGLSL